MNAIELNILIDILERRGEDRQLEAATMLRQQVKEIEQLKADVAGWMDTAIGKTPDEGYWLNLFKKASEK